MLCIAGSKTLTWPYKCASGLDQGKTLKIQKTKIHIFEMHLVTSKQKSLLKC